MFRRIMDKIRCAIKTIKSAEGNELLIVVVDKRISQMMLQDYDKKLISQKYPGPVSFRHCGTCDSMGLCVKTK